MRPQEAMISAAAVILLLLAPLSRANGDQAGGSHLPPEPYSRFSFDHRASDAKEKGPTQNGPPIGWWSYYADAAAGSPSTRLDSPQYQRSSPGAWGGRPDSSSIRAVVVSRSRFLEIPDFWGAVPDEILELSSRPRMAHGPRRRRRNAAPSSSATLEEKQKLAIAKLELVRDLKDRLSQIPLFCWKVLVNCRRRRRHVCCPVMPSSLKRDKRKKRKKNNKKKNKGRAETTKGEDDLSSSEAGKARSRSRRSPTSVPPPPPPKFTGYYNPPVLQHPFLPPDVGRQRQLWKVWTRQEEEGQEGGAAGAVDRVFPIGPYVQPSLIENWVSAAFALFGNDPLVYIAVKKVLVLALLAAGFVAWGAFGQWLGFVPKFKADREAELEVAARAVEAALARDWSKDGEEETVSPMALCCLTEEEGNTTCKPKEAVEGGGCSGGGWVEYEVSLNRKKEK